MALRKRGYLFFNLLQKEGGTQKGGVFLRKGKVPTPEETMILFLVIINVQR